VDYSEVAKWFGNGAELPGSKSVMNNVTSPHYHPPEKDFAP